MGYLEDFQVQINQRDFSKFLQLWEEYSKSDQIEAEEFIELLKMIKLSEFSKLFGQLVETALPLWQMVENQDDSYTLLKYLIDLQVTNTQILGDLSLEAIKQRYGNQAEFHDRLRLVGLRPRDNFQGALSNYDLLAHVSKGHFVFHAGGWGTGEIMENSFVREQLSIEFENVPGRKHITYTNAFKMLTPLPSTHFLARRFADADNLESQAKENPAEVIKLLLADLGPMSAQEIKTEMCERVIPEKEWTKWWQGARAKIKKDPMIDSPEGSKGEFRLRKVAAMHEDRFSEILKKASSVDEILQISYNFIRDFPNILKKEEIKQTLYDTLAGICKDPKVTPSQELQALSLLDSHFPVKEGDTTLKDCILQLQDIETVINKIQIITIKKKLFTLIREVRSDWQELFLHFLIATGQATLKDYLLKELNKGDSKKILMNELKALLQQPDRHPELFMWYFNKLVAQEDKDLPFADKKGQLAFFESFFILYSLIENKPEYRDLVKKMYTFISDKRFAVVRKLFEGTTLEYIKECLLLISKCQTLPDHDIKILRSLAEVVHPTLAAAKPSKYSSDMNIFWTTEAGYLRTQERAQKIGTVEIVENAREVEAARALGDLRENSEYKFALEKRSRLQRELKTLSDQLKHARLITPRDISSDEVGIGNVVELMNLKNQNKITYTILGPWEADVDAGILSTQSKFVQAMYGLKEGDTFQFRDDEFKIISIKSYLNI